MENTNIEWTDHTFNPWMGCTKVSPGCDHCYAERDMDHRLKRVQWGPQGQRVRTVPANWRKPVAWNANHELFYAAHGRRQRVFCASLADVFDNAVDPMWRQDLANLIQDTPNLDWLLLTKRIGNAGEMLGEMFLDGVPGNVWMGASIVNQAEADRDIVKLLKMPTSVRFLSMEPLLGPVDLTDIPHPMRAKGADWVRLKALATNGIGDGINWVIVGGESGPQARPMHPDWARSLRDQCAAVGVPFLFKQWGEWTPGENVGARSGTVETALLLHNGAWLKGQENLACTEGHVDDEPDLYRVGKMAAGRLLDGRLHDGYPEVGAAQ